MRDSILKKMLKISSKAGVTYNSCKILTANMSEPELAVFSTWLSHAVKMQAEKMDHVRRESEVAAW